MDGKVIFEGGELAQPANSMAIDKMLAGTVKRGLWEIAKRGIVFGDGFNEIGRLAEYH